LDLNDAPTGGLELVGYFDTNPTSDSPVFDGTWSNYPYFPSGNIAVSSMTHFFMVRPSQSIAPGTTSTVESTTAQTSLQIFPNPANDVVRIEGWKGSLRAYDLSGKCLKRWSSLPGASGLHLNVLDLPNGLYVLQDESGATARFAVQR
jgi:hypothetical protein